MELPLNTLYFHFCYLSILLYAPNVGTALATARNFLYNSAYVGTELGKEVLNCKAAVLKEIKIIVENQAIPKEAVMFKKL
jgi:hypothetical protein